MISIRTSADIEAPIDEIWADLSDIPSHAEWMRDAETVRLLDGTIEADTRLGPFRATDRMEITAWAAESAIEVRHVGRVTGTGRFSLEAIGSEGTRLIWEERLSFPWQLGGRVGEWIALPILRALFVANLRAFRQRHA